MYISKICSENIFCTHLKNVILKTFSLKVFGVHLWYFLDIRQKFKTFFSFDIHRHDNGFLYFLKSAHNQSIILNHFKVRVSDAV